MELVLEKLFFTHWCLDDVITACVECSHALGLPLAVDYTAVLTSLLLGIHRVRKKPLFYPLRRKDFYMEILMKYLGLYKSVAHHEMQVRNANRNRWLG